LRGRSGKDFAARSTSNTTHAVARKSRWASAGNSAGVRMVSIFILRRAKEAMAVKKIYNPSKF
jgi:hypothetical protein